MPKPAPRDNAREERAGDGGGGVSGSAIYEGWVAHRRLTGVPHAFRYRVFLPLFDLDELPELLDPIPLWSARGPAPARFRRTDYLGEGALQPRRRSPRRWRRRTPDAGRRGRLGCWPTRATWASGSTQSPSTSFTIRTGDLDAVIAEVTNTPWGERVTYVLDGRVRRGDAITAGFAKSMHVSPFQPMDQRYEISVSPPGEALRIQITNLQDGRPVFRAALALRRRELTRAAMVGALFRHPPMTLATLGRIYANALRLKLRGAPHYKRPPASSPGLARDRGAARPQASRRTRSTIRAS